MRVRYTPRARTDLKEIDAYLRQRSPQGARNVRLRVRDVVCDLGDMPGTGRETDFPGVRVTPLVRFPYKIYYRIVGNEVHILHVRHGARDEPTTEDIQG